MFDLARNKGDNPFTNRGVLFEFFTWIETIRTDIKYDILYKRREKSLNGVLFSFAYLMCGKNLAQAIRMRIINEKEYLFRNENRVKLRDAKRAFFWAKWLI